jgi:threonine/homoserine/homoserine lactone efflux protein
MFGIHHYWLFVLSGLLLNLVPGQDTLYILGRSIAQGRRAGILSVLGISTGCLVHTLAAAFGLSALLVASSQAFTAVKLIGAAYLLYLGLRMLASGSAAPAAQAETRPVASDGAIYRQGILTNVLNPKVALFFLALLPQFIDAQCSAKVMAFLILGLTFIVNGTLWCILVACFAASFSRRLRERPAIETWLKRTAGAVFIGLGLKLALVRR